MVLLLFLSTLMIGASVFYAVFLLGGVVISSRRVYRSKKTSQDYEEKQLNQIRESSVVFRNFEVLVREIQRLTDKKSIADEKLDQGLFFTEMSPPWSPSLFVATKWTTAALIFLAFMLFQIIFLGASSWFCMALGGGIALLYRRHSVNGVKDRGTAIKERVVHRLPFVVDLMALVRRANAASFAESLKIIATENANHPIGKIFATAYVDSRSLPESEVLERLSERMRDPSFDEVNKTIVNADAMGRPVADALMQLAKTMRLKRQQWGEVACGKAQVKIIFPGTIVMCGCLLTIIAPFVLRAIHESNYSFF